jgi:hypothetical protein
MTVYRSMRADSDELPVVGRASWALGVRIEGLKRDVHVGEDGLVRPLGGGMSVGLGEWHSMPQGLIPVELGGTNPRNTMFSLEMEALPTELTIRQSGANKAHHVIEPRRKMPIQHYEDLLAETRDRWVRVEQ